MDLAERIRRGERPFERVERGSSIFFLVAESDLEDLVFGTSQLSLTPRQREIMSYAIKGMSNKTIAVLLGISVRTVEAHRLLARRRLNGKS